MRPEAPGPVKIFIGALYSDQALLQQALLNCETAYSSIDYRSEQFEFAVTEYYDAEMGSPIFRQFFSFTELGNPGQLADWKITTNQIEANLAQNGSRKVNLDIGYMDYHKVVLASAKFNGQKIYLDHGIYADPTLYYRKGHFHPYDWSFPDFKNSDEYYDALLKIREIYKGQRPD